MQTLGVGVDIIENYRIKKSIRNKKFLTRIFSKTEITDSKKTINKSSYFSKRFAAKEAFSKASGLGISRNLHFKNIEIKKNNKGRPSINLQATTKKFLKKKFNVKSFKTNLSLSDEQNYSIAYVIIEKT